MSLKKALKDLIETTLQGELKEGSKISECKIADIQFAFNNHKLIVALQGRGKCIVKQDFDAMREKEKEIAALFDSPDEFKELTRPTAAFITFEEEDAKNIALELGDRDTEFFGKLLKFYETSEPTDIIWENRHFTRNDIFWRGVCAWIVILILLFGSFIFIYWVSSISSEVAHVFPTKDCDNVYSTYGS